jgi:long-chain acyl-CoA synthetase
MLLHNGPEWPALFFGIALIGAVCVPLNPDSPQAEIENILNDSEAAILLVGDTKLHDKIRGLKCRLLKEIIILESAEFKTKLKNSTPNLSDDAHVAAGDTACILYTSGTTAVPKGAVLSHKNLTANLQSLRKLGLVSAKDSFFSVLPLHHAYPLMVTMLLPLLSGCKVIYSGTLRSEEFIKAIEKTRPTFFVGVPEIYYLLSKKIKERLNAYPLIRRLLLNILLEFLYAVRRITGANPAKFLLYPLHRGFGGVLRAFVSGGAKLDEEVEKFLFKLGFTVLEGYGLTETSPVLTMNTPRKYKIGSAGTAIPDVELRIDSPAENGIGEVVVRGANVMEGYYKRNDLTKEVFKDGWFCTGDLGYLDKDGYLFLTGRSKEVIVLSSGLNIYPEGVETAYSNAPAVKEMCVFDLPARKGEAGPLLWAVVVPDLEYFRRFGQVNLRIVVKEQFDDISRSLPPYQRLMGFQIRTEPLPRTLLGKIKRYEVKSRYSRLLPVGETPKAEKEESEEDIKLAESDTAKKIIAYLKDKLNIKEKIGVRDLLEIDLGIDSLGRLELASGLEKVFGVAIKDELIGDCFSVKDLIVGIDKLLVHGAPKRGPEEKEAVREKKYWRSVLEKAPSPENLVNIDLNPGFLEWLAGFIFLLPIYAVFKLFYRLKVEGIHNLPAMGSCILYANHTSYFDGFIVAVSLRNRPELNLFFVGFRPFFEVPVIRRLIRIGRIIPLDFSSHFTEAMRSCYYILTKGKFLCVFPEGIRSADGEIHDFKKGFGILAKEAGVPLIPILIKGAFQAWPRTAVFPKIHPLRVKIGAPISVGELEKEAIGLAKDAYEGVCVAAKERLKKLKYTK